MKKTLTTIILFASLLFLSHCSNQKIEKKIETGVYHRKLPDGTIEIAAIAKPSAEALASGQISKQQATCRAAALLAIHKTLQNVYNIQKIQLTIRRVTFVNQNELCQVRGIHYHSKLEENKETLEEKDGNQ